MAVAHDAERIDVALDEVAALLRRRADVASLGERIGAALDIAALWNLIGRHALDQGDAELAAIAGREYRHYIDAAVNASPARAP